MPEGASQLIAYGPTVALLLVLVFLAIRIVPHWKEVKLAEISVRKDEATAKTEQALAISRLTDVLKHTTDATDELKIFLRASMSKSRANDERLSNLEQSVLRIEEQMRR